MAGGKHTGKVKITDLIAPSFYRAFKDIQNSKDTDPKSPTCGQPLREYFFRGGRGCVSGDTSILTPNGEVRIRDFTGGLIYAYDGERLVETYACKPIEYTEEDIYEVATKSGAVVSCTDEHRFFVGNGWKMLKELAVGDCVFSYRPYAPQASSCDMQDRATTSCVSLKTNRVSASSSDAFQDLSTPVSSSRKDSCDLLRSRCDESQTMLHEDVRHSMRTLLSCLYHHWQDCRLCDGQLQTEEETYRDVLLQLIGVPEHTRENSHAGGQDVLQNDTHSHLCGFPPSTQDCPFRTEGIRYGGAGIQTSQMLSEWLSESVRAVAQSLESGGRDGSIQQVARLLLSSIDSYDRLCVQSSGQSDPAEAYIRQTLCDMLLRNVRDESWSNSFRCIKDNAYSRSPCIKPDNIASIRKVKRERYWDMFVPFYNNYISNGIVSHNSTKSSFISLMIVSHLLQNPNVNAVVFVKVAENIRDSVYKQILWAISHLELDAFFKCTTSPFRCEYIPTGQEILFRGLDKSGKIKGIKPAKGYFDTIWFEELTEFSGMEDVRSVIQSVLRGTDEQDDGGEGTGADVRTWEFYSYNPPPTVANWVNVEANARVEGRKVYSSNYLTVPPKWLGKEFYRRADGLRLRNKRAFMHEYLGYVTGTGGNVFNNLVIRKITDDEITKCFNNRCFGIDWGFTTDPFVWLAMHFDTDRMILYIFDEIYERGLRTQQSAERVKAKMARVGGNIPILADCAEPDSIADFNAWGINVEPCPKPHGMTWSGRDYSIKALSDLYKIVIDPEYCPNAAREFQQYEFQKNAHGEFMAQYPKANDHCFSGDTLVRTDDGDIPISSLVGKNGKVLSYDEVAKEFTWCGFYDCSLTFESAETVIVELENGLSLECTPDHFLLTRNRGWIEAISIREDDEIMCL